MKCIKNYIRKIMLEILDEPAEKPKFDIFKEIRFKNKKNLTVYDIIETLPFYELKFNIGYIDQRSGAHCKDVISVQTLSEFKHELEKLKPAHPCFDECTFLVRYGHEFGPQTVYDFIISSTSATAYDSSEIYKITASLLKWINKRPELLI